MSAPSNDGQVVVSCEDFMLFQNSLKKWRLIDDRLIYALNTSLPTKSFSSQVNPTEQCEHLYQKLTKRYSDREKSIKTCITQVSANVKKLQEKKTKQPDNSDLIRLLSTEQRKLRLMQSEMNVEEVLRDNSLKIFYERCRDYYTPSSAPIV
ncbi:protein MIX23-like [Gigantopelta aegis]|uniref:protein MIX23-like n=1 Tax=Gigantopelta aegis TaxID=1735272 RepID=UPI001B888516|nr:protein MIX23-like [Gigantopelta aegis]